MNANTPLGQDEHAIGELVYLDQHRVPELPDGEAIRVLPFEDHLWFLGPTCEDEHGRFLEYRSRRHCDDDVHAWLIDDRHWELKPRYGGVGIRVPIAAVPTPPLPDDHPWRNRDDTQVGLEEWASGQTPPHGGDV